MKSYSIEKTTQGAYKFTGMLFGELFTRQYFFPKREAELLFREARMHEFLKNSLGPQTIDHSERKTAERLEAKGIITITKHLNATWQVKLI
jgi:hypothetical protein